MAKKRTAHTNPTPANKPAQGGEESPIVRANVNRQEVIGQTFASIYTNDVQVQTTPWDVRLILGELFQAPSEANPNAVIRQLGEVRLSPQLAKKVTALLQQQLDVYEKRFGLIPQPPED